MLIDSHCHLNFPDFKDDLDEVIKNAGNNGVSQMLSICTKLSEYEEIKQIAANYDNVFCTVGVHPHEAENHAEVKAENLVALANYDKCIGLGETGLDYFYENSPREIQKNLFLEHIKAAQETDLPVIIHTRSADEDTIDIINTQNFRGLLHCFSTDYKVAESALDNGLYISISGIVTFKKAEELREAVKKIPLERLLVETDAPYLAPIPMRGKRNEPAFTKHTAEFVAELKGVSFEELARITTKNFYTLFSKINKG
ncbi:MAG: LuxR family transcriptional regulator [Alphaproteobacteria bacterium CG11_big_fil_rev_8_21_14_0_20_44_7]|nr:MAG: LuxR family transcriptional regulator [Alphaproteobacteria bacterium CG11_big_fil_rev_8_21_14_0_20_44_7]